MVFQFGNDLRMAGFHAYNITERVEVFNYPLRSWNLEIIQGRIFRCLSYFQMLLPDGGDNAYELEGLE